MQYVNALSPPIAGERVVVEGWGVNGHLLEAYSTEPTCKPQSTMCSFWDLRRYAVAVAVAAVAGRGKLKNVRQMFTPMFKILSLLDSAKNCSKVFVTLLVWPKACCYTALWNAEQQK